jgi:hypothetical protein
MKMIFLLQTLLRLGVMALINLNLDDFRKFPFKYKIAKLTMCNHSSKGNYKIECRATRTSDKCKGKIRCLGGVSILCWPVTPALSPTSNSNIGSQNQCFQIRWTEQSAVKISVHIRYMEYSTLKIRLTQTSGNIRSRIRCLGGVSILCWPVTPAVRP